MNAPLDHFEPLLRAAKTGIVTLNYDQLVERAGEKFVVEVSTRQDEDTLGGLLWAMDAEYRTPDADAPSVAATLGQSRIIFLTGGVGSLLPALVV